MATLVSSFCLKNLNALFVAALGLVATHPAQVGVAKKLLSSKLSNFLKYHSLPWVEGKVQYLSGISYYNIGVEINGKKAPKALLFVPIESIDFYVQGRYEEGVSTKMHNIYFQFLAILKSLVDHGFVVDCVKKDTPDFQKNISQYRLILDEGDTMAYLPKVDNQMRLMYCTGTKWDRWNRDELRRLEWFEQRYGIFIKPVRQLKPIFSDHAANYILYKGVSDQMHDFSNHATRIQLAMPVEFEPEEVVRDFTGRDFVWVGGWGAIHKGLDIAVDAFEKMPQFRLNIFGPIPKESQVMKWLEMKTKVNNNIFYHGYAHFDSTEFLRIISTCAGHVYPSAGENGCATLAQTAHFGLLPITTNTSNNQANHLGYNIEGHDRDAMIDSICDSVERIGLMSDQELESRSKGVIDFAKKRFTREAFINSFNDFLVSEIPLAKD